MSASNACFPPRREPLVQTHKHATISLNKLVNKTRTPPHSRKCLNSRYGCYVVFVCHWKTSVVDSLPSRVQSSQSAGTLEALVCPREATSRGLQVGPVRVFCPFATWACGCCCLVPDDGFGVDTKGSSSTQSRSGPEHQV